MTKKIMYVLVSSASVKQGTVMIHSCASTTRVSELMEAAPNALVWQQLYLFKNKLLTQQLIKEAEASGVKALVVTVDAAGGCNRRISPYTEGSREHACNTEFRLPNFEISTPDCLGYQKMGDQNLWAYCAFQCQESSNSLEDLRWVQTITSLPIVVKGIIKGSDAKKVIEEGIASAIIVSAHGGRQLDGIPAPIDALGEILEAVRETGSNTEVYMDGGIRSGSDVFKALAVGAKAVFVGRPALWGLAANGTEGVSHVLELFRGELSDVMAQCGCATLSDITPSSVINEAKYLAKLEP
ncbi:putative hydroxyacid oxidase 1 [Apostichopus japonicus]|uniref:Putative hydroxyacid oxidase 1 n=1 Tax=Stichopus japonicus TaxID=307972 RepID=A0A2G8JBG1_STIJA|nr:putative hydroxyacid oxidase 1 [Apostichopus japonicus]